MNQDAIVRRLKNTPPYARIAEYEKIEKEFGRGFARQVREAVEKEPEPKKPSRGLRR